MYVRLGFAVAVMVRPEILIVDEVIAVGDEEFQRKCYDYLHGLRRSGTSLIVVSHGLSQINDLCDDALWLDRGLPQMLGPSRRVTQAYVDSVNAKEADRAQGSACSDSGAQQQKRRGTGAIRVTSLAFLRSDGTPAPLVSTGDALTVRMSYVASTTVTDVAFGVSAINAEGLPVLILGSNDAAPWTIPAGSGHVDLRMGQCLLAPGAYTLKSTVTVESSILDADDVGVPLMIRAGARAVGGVFRQPCEWSHMPLPEGAEVYSRRGDI
jgi:ABC-2 type transport system ATP-binding protein/lipopolysaccharide transport system ATP-binding protein